MPVKDLPQTDTVKELAEKYRENKDKFLKLTRGALKKGTKLAQDMGVNVLPKSLLEQLKEIGPSTNFNLEGDLSIVYRKNGKDIRKTVDLSDLERYLKQFKP